MDAGAKAFQQVIAQSGTLPPLACCLLVVHPGAISFTGDHMHLPVHMMERRTCRFGDALTQVFSHHYLALDRVMRRSLYLPITFDFLASETDLTWSEISVNII